MIISQLSKILLTLIAVFALLFVLLLPSYASAQGAGDAVCDTLGQATGERCQTEEESSSTLETVIQGALNLLTFAAGVITVIMVIIAGVKFLTSRGDPGAVANARGTLLYALIGIVVVVLSQTIIFFFISSSRSDEQPPQRICPAGEVCRQ